MPDITYPLDTTGVAPSNLVTNEIHVLTADNNANYRLIVPDFAPIFPDNLAVSHQDAEGNWQPLTKGVHYSLASLYLSGSRSIGTKTLYGTISVNDNTLLGLIRIDTYQTVGGGFAGAANSAFVREQLATDLFNPRKATWDEITGVQTLFPPTEHALDMSDTTGYQDLLDKLDTVVDAIANADHTTNQFVLHMLAEDNPHNVTKAQVNLGLVENLPLATTEQVNSMAEVDAYITLKQLKTILVTNGVGQPADYVSTSQLATALSDYVPATALSNYVTNNSLSTTLAGYVTDGEMTAALSAYTLTSALNTALTPINTALNTNSNNIVSIQNSMATQGDLANYVTATQLSTALNDVVSTSELTTTLGGYVSDTELATILAGFIPASGGGDTAESMLLATSFNK